MTAASRFHSPNISCIGLAVLVSATALRAQDTHSSTWSVSWGAAVLVAPEYAGSDEYRVIPFPLGDVMYRDRIYLGRSRTALGSALGAYVFRSSRVTVALEAGALPNRRASRADALAGMDDRDWVGAAGASASSRLGPFDASVSVVRGFNDGAGTLASTGLSITRPIGRLFPTVSAGVTFADAKQMRRDFGVTPTEATRRQALIDAGDPKLSPEDGIAYRPNASLHHVSAGVSMVYVFSRRWSIMSIGGVDAASDEARRSPLVQTREQYWGLTGIVYKF